MILYIIPTPNPGFPHKDRNNGNQPLKKGASFYRNKMFDTTSRPISPMEDPSTQILTAEVGISLFNPLTAGVPNIIGFSLLAH